MEHLEKQGGNEKDISFNTKLFIKIKDTDTCIDVTFDITDNIIKKFNKFENCYKKIINYIELNKDNNFYNYDKKLISDHVTNLLR